MKWRSCLPDITGSPLSDRDQATALVEAPGPLISTRLIDHDDIGAEPIDNEPDDRRRQDGVTVEVGPKLTPAALDPNEIVGNDPFGNPETRAQRIEGMKI